MANITLRNMSGGWEYKTTVDDPLFSSILGAMFEEGMELPDELVIEGTLGEALEREWKYVELLKLWKEWEKMYTEVPLIEHAGERIVREGIHTYTLRTSEFRRGSIYPGYHGETVSVRDVPPPRRVLWLHEMTVLPTALSLPSGWELHVAVDERTPIQARRHHLHSSLEYIRKNAVSVMYPRVVVMFDHAEDEVRIMAEGRDSRLIARECVLDALIRNVWLIEWNEHLSTDPENTDLPYVGMPAMLDRMDWQLAREILPAKEDGKYYGTPAIDLAGFMLGEGCETSCSAGVAVHQLGLGFWQWSIVENFSRLARIYSRLLSYLPEDATPTQLGLMTILGENDKNMNWVSVDRLVPWIHYSTITYIKWIRTQSLLADRRINHGERRGLDASPIVRSDFPEIVEFLGETLGLYAMRRILLSLLYYISNNADKARKLAKKENVSEKTKKKHEKALYAVERAELFAELLEDYITAHNGEDEDVRTMEMGKLTRAEKARHYYD